MERSETASASYWRERDGESDGWNVKLKEWLEYKCETENDGVQEVLLVGEACSPGGGVIGSLDWRREGKAKEQKDPSTYKTEQ